MDTKNQFICFLLSVLIGFAGGLLYEFFAFFRLTLGCKQGKRKGIGVVLDLLFGVTFAVWAIFASFWFHFSAFRVYMSVGWLIGGIIYAKTLRRMVAFFQKMCYTICTRMVKRQKARIKVFKKERI